MKKYCTYVLYSESGVFYVGSGNKGRPYVSLNEYSTPSGICGHNIEAKRRIQQGETLDVFIAFETDNRYEAYKVEYELINAYGQTVVNKLRCKNPSQFLRRKSWQV